jgi:hypothetical protein
VFKRLYDEHEAEFSAGGDYRHQSDIREPLTVRVVGIPYHGIAYDWERFSSIEKGDEDFLVAVGHVLASPKGGSMFEGEDIVKYADLDALAPDVWCFGHWHKDQGVTEIAPGKWVVNVGSLSRGSIKQDDVERTPKVAILRFGDGVEIEKHSIDIQPPEEVFDIEGRVRAESREFSIDAFVDSIHDTLAESEQEPIPDVIRGMPSVPDPVRERALVYWEESR